MNWQAAVERTVTGLGYDLVDSEWSGKGLLRVYIDRVFESVTSPAMAVGSTTGAEQFITVEDCEKVTRQLQHVLEVENCAYERLEVSSPGLDRPLKKPADYARFVGEQIEVSLKVPFEGRKRWSGILQSGEGGKNGPDDGWRLVITTGEIEQAFDFTLSEVREARLVPVLDFKGRRFAPPPAIPAGGGSDTSPTDVDVDHVRRGTDEQVAGGCKE